MVEYIEQLIEEQKYEEALRYAEEALRQPLEEAEELLRLNCALLQSRFYISDYNGALVSGKVAYDLAIQLEHWNLYGTTCLFLGVIHQNLGQLQTAIHYCYRYIERLSMYSKALRHEVMVRYNLAIWLDALGETKESLKSLNEALRAAERSGNERDKHGLRQAAIHTLLKSEDLEKVPRLLAQTLAYLRRQSDVPHHRQSLLYHFKLRAEFALKTERPMRATAVAHRGLKLAKGIPFHQFELNMVLAKAALLIGDYPLAIRRALEAKMSAMEGRLYEFEMIASSFMYDVLKKQKR